MMNTAGPDHVNHWPLCVFKKRSFVVQEIFGKEEAKGLIMTT